jgi:hypothetical protein
MAIGTILNVLSVIYVISFALTIYNWNALSKAIRFKEHLYPSKLKFNPWIRWISITHLFNIEDQFKVFLQNNCGKEYNRLRASLLAVVCSFATMIIKVIFYAVLAN